MSEHSNAPEQRTIDVDIEQVRAEGNTLKGHAAVFNVLSEDLGGYREKIAAGAFRDVLDSDVRLLVNHKPDHVLARTKSGTLRLSEDDTGLVVEADLPDTSYARDLRESLRRRDVDGMSFRFTVGRESWEGDVRTVETVKHLEDVCLATYPAYPSASVELRTRPNISAADEAEEESDMSTTEEVTIGGLAVEDRTAEQPTIEQRLGDAMREVKKGESRALTTAVSVSPVEASTVLFDKLRASSVGLSTGMRVVSTDRDSISWPTLTADAVPAWYAEAAAITAGDPTFSTLTATPRKLAHLVQFSNEVIDDSDPSVVEVVRQNLLRTMALKLDIALFEGSGTPPEIRGLKNVAGIQTISMGVNGANVTSLDTIADALALLEAVNTQASAIVMPPRTFNAIRKFKDTANQYIVSTPTSGTSRTLFGVPVYVSGQLSVTETQGTSSLASSIYVMAASEVVYVRRQEVQLELDRSRLFNSDQSELRGTMRGDLIVPNPTAVVRVLGVTN